MVDIWTPENNLNKDISPPQKYFINLSLKPYNMKCQNLLLLAGLGIGYVFSACNKMKDAPLVPPVAKSSGDSSLVLTPDGYVPAYKVHHIQKGYALMRKGGHMLKVESKSGAIIEDYGEIHSPATTSSSTTMTTLGGAGKTARGVLPATENLGWVTNTIWENTSSSPIVYFITAWPVPNLPTTTTDGQTIFFFNGLGPSNGGSIAQPVLQWGLSAAGDANGWGIANWYVWGDNDHAISDLITVQPGTPLEGAITYTGQNSTGSYDYTSTFYNLTTNTAYDNTLTIIEGDDPSGFIIPVVPQLVYAYETLEAYNSEGVNGGYGVVQASDYPAGQNFLNMYDILINVGGTVTSDPTWTVVNNNPLHGESTDLTPKLNNSTNGGQAVWIYWHSVPTIGGATFVPLTTSSTSYTITGYPGTVVNIELTANSIILGLGGGRESGTTTATITATTSGVTFSNGSTSITSTNGSAYYTVTMPASGSFTVNASYTSTGSGLKDVFASVF
jgi:hypothetical protein